MLPMSVHRGTPEVSGASQPDAIDPERSLLLTPGSRNGISWL